MNKPSKLLSALAAVGIAVGISVGVGSDPSFAAKFKDPGDKGRPDIFGPPGKPVIGPPGQYEG